MKWILSSMVFLIALAVVSSAMAVLPTAKVEYPDGDMGKVVFNGSTHGPKQGMKCSDCHPEPFGPPAKHPERMKILATDHTEGKLCGKCHDGKEHNGKTVFSWAAKDSCGKCHEKAGDMTQEKKEEAK